MALNAQPERDKRTEAIVYRLDDLEQTIHLATDSLNDT
jgi:hypothetical protein